MTRIDNSLHTFSISAHIVAVIPVLIGIIINMNMTMARGAWLAAIGVGVAFILPKKKKEEKNPFNSLLN